jgi:hypothetical protein
VPCSSAMRSSFSRVVILPKVFARLGRMSTQGGDFHPRRSFGLPYALEIRLKYGVDGRRFQYLLLSKRNHRIIPVGNQKVGVQ